MTRTAIVRRRGRARRRARRDTWISDVRTMLWLSRRLWRPVVHEALAARAHTSPPRLRPRRASRRRARRR
jgi:hypothetical protein